MIRSRIFFLTLLALLCLSACGKRNIVVLMNDPDGTHGSVEVSNESGTVVLDAPLRATVIGDKSTAPAAPFTMAEKEVNDVFGPAVAARPEIPVHFILHFKVDSTELSPESLKSLSMVMDAVKERASVNISVIGHTDTAGDKAYNLKLSMRRAMAVKKRLVEKGVPEAHIDTTSHGERNPLVKTEDNVSNPLNRRVEVIVR